jgi:hypothetical protein
MRESEIENKIREIQHMLNAINISIQHGGSFLVSRCAPNGPIMREPNLSYIHKASWGMYAADVDHDIIARLLDWAVDNALQPNGDFYIPGEDAEYKDMQRAYRPLTFGKVASWIDHPLIKDDLVLGRLLQYQHSSGGVFNYIGDDPNNIEEQPTIGTLNTSFFGHLMIALEIQKEAIMAGDWLCRFVQKNRDYMLRDGIMYANMTPDGELVTDVKPGERISGMVDNRSPKQEFWQPGTVMAYLAVLYEKLRDEWGKSEAEAQAYLNNALILLDFEDTMPLYTYLWPSKCKVGWGAGELLRVLVKYEKGSQEQIEKAYRTAKNVAVFTFMDNQLPNGGWYCMHYPLSELIPEMEFDYKPLKGLVNLPDSRIDGSQTIFLPGEEITGEFLGEMKSIQMGVEKALAYYKSLKMGEE